MGNDILLMKLAQYFVAKHNYKFVDVKAQKNEVWLATNANDVYPILRISLTNVGQMQFDKTRLLEIHKAIGEFFQTDSKLLDIHLVEQVEISDVVDEDIKLLAICNNQFIGEDILKVFPKIKEDLKQMSEPTKGTNNSPFQLFKNGTNRYALNKMPLCTYIIAVICLVVFALTNFIASSLSGDSVTAAIVMGAYYKAFIVAGFEYFRLLTVGFVHYDLIHFMMNMVALINLGNICEKIYTKTEFLIILFGSVVSGSLFIFAAQGNVLTVGLSGGLYGLMAALLVYGFDSKVIYNPAVARSFISTLIINIFITFLPGISLYGHLGGFVGGLFIAIMFTKNKAWKVFKQNAVVAFIVMLAFLGYRSFTNANVQPIYYSTDKLVLDFMDSIGFDSYSKNMENKLESFYGFQIR